MVYTNNQIAFFVFLGLFLLMLVLYFSFAWMYCKSRKSIDKMYAYQRKYKEYSIISFSSLIKPLELLGKRETLAKNSSNLKLVIEYMHDYDEQYKKQLTEIWKAIDQLTNLKNHFNFGKTKKMFKQIDMQFDKLDIWIKDFKDLTKDSSIYQNEASKVIVEYRSLVDQLITFLKEHILVKYDSPVFKDFLSNISKNFEDANTALMMFQNEKYVKSLENLRYSIYTLLTYANRLYVLDKKNDYLKFLVQEIKLLYKKAESEKGLANQNKLSEIYRILSDADDGIIKIDTHLHLLQFKEAEELITNLLKILQPMQANLATESEAKSIISLGLNNFIKGVNSLEEKSNTLTDAIKKLNKIFEGHAEILQKINLLKTLFNSIKSSIAELQKFNINNPNDNYSKLLEKITVFIDLVTKLKDNINELVLDIEKEISLYKNTVHKINDLNLKYSQLQKYISENNLFLDKKLFDIFLDYKTVISKKTILAKDDYRNILENFDLLAEKADKLFIKVLQTVVELSSIKEMTQLTLMFLNKYRYENVNIEKNINVIQELYQYSNYELALERAIKLLDVMKRSAESNNLTLN
ncbi:septation ring formation regulator EzrA [Mycoplasmoides pirum]|uniref:septation ring formation regulator EzrA n=1 Tax=Mycoplasmoides pirum TaxID=2122 RepID=UPI00047FC450|nr:septation ring formation regulator EzrA [Mycoplasmoides pirum]